MFSDNIFGSILQQGLPQDPRIDQAMQDKGPSGLFGLRGSARDIIGHLGDIYLQRQGLKPAYQQQRMGEEMGDFASDPLGAMQRIAKINPTAAMEMYDNYNKQQQLGDYRKAQTADRTQDNGFQTERNLGGMVANVLQDPSVYSQALPVLQMYAKARGYDLSPYGLTGNFEKDRAALTTLSGFGSTSNQVNNGVRADRSLAERTDYHKTTAGQAQQRIGVADMNANTAASRAATDANYKSERLNDFDADRTLREKQGRKKGKASALSQITGGAPGSKSKFKEGQTLYQGGHKFVVKNGKPVYSE